MREENLKRVYEQELIELERDYKHILMSELEDMLTAALPTAVETVREMNSTKYVKSKGTQTHRVKKREAASQTKRPAAQLSRATSSWDLQTSAKPSPIYCLSNTGTLPANSPSDLDSLLEKMADLSCRVNGLRIRVANCDAVLQNTTLSVAETDSSIPTGYASTSTPITVNKTSSHRWGEIGLRRHRRRRHQYRRHR